ncbi:hypothetical protein SAMN07250955_104157 [Arboricoccus pini]|uniref:DUF2065 domain-containing protein n=1 Tax=Arboricoccus pini TaxID=1963835 RepID=A0A212QYU3_9PROT|nr:DUF2065 domain-containing protein [Arboricoccus pini]SNB64889.1 hypothetical protein SAMN07250955_104157 [Arboricoccus pini]
MVGGGLGDFLVGMGLVLVIEGALWSLFPNAMRRASRAILALDTPIIRGTGLAVAVAGVGLVWLVRHR